MKSQGETNHWVYWSIHCTRTSIQINYCHSHSIENVTLQNNLDPGESYLVLKGIINNLEGTVEGGCQKLLLSFLQVFNQLVLVNGHIFAKSKRESPFDLISFVDSWNFKSIIVKPVRNKTMYILQLNSNKEFKSSEDYNITKLSMK